MSAKSKAFAFTLFPALLLAMVVFGSLGILPTHSAFAAEKSVERIGCDNGRKRCEARCEATMIDVGHQIDACKRDCQHEWLDCLPIGETPDAPKAPLTKVQPKFTPGGVETQGTTAPNVPPKGGVLQAD